MWVLETAAKVLQGIIKIATGRYLRPVHLCLERSRLELSLRQEMSNQI
jgi:hypothetical protein